MLAVSHLRKTFDRVVAVDDISLEVQRGEMYGLLGPNGAGKTTAIRTILDIIKPDSGDITFDGEPFSEELWNNIGYLPEERGLYKKSKILTTILYFAALKGVPVAEARPQAIRWLERFDLAHMAQAKVEELSKGNQQKVQIISSLIHTPDLLILDEPFSGLDPVNQILLKDILIDLRKQNVAIIFSTHQMEQVERLCDNISLINKGKSVLQGNIREIKSAHGTNTVHVEFDGDGTFLKTMKGVRKADVYPNSAELELEDLSKGGALLTAVSAKVDVRKFEVREPSLQTIFVSVVGGEQTIQEAAAKSIEGLPKGARQKRPGTTMPRKDLFGLLLGVLAGGFVILRELTTEEPDLRIVGLVVVVVAYVGFRVWKGWKVRTSEAPSEEGP